MEIHREKNAVSVKEACEKFRADGKARNLSAATVKKYKYVLAELEEKFGSLSVRNIGVEDLRTLREGWTFSPTTARKRVEYLRAFFTFCLSSGWIPANPAKGLEPPVQRTSPTLPFSQEEWEKILWALDLYGDIHAQGPERIRRQLKALVLLMRYSGLRISDAVSLKRERIDAKGRLFCIRRRRGIRFRFHCRRACSMP
jgi:site-specific recombinase XerD